MQYQTVVKQLFEMYILYNTEKPMRHFVRNTHKYDTG